LLRAVKNAGGFNEPPAFSHVIQVDPQRDMVIHFM